MSSLPLPSPPFPSVPSPLIHPLSATYAPFRYKSHFCQELKLLNPETDYYKNLAIEIQKFHISVDQFFFGSFNNLATFGM
jgi:hypothetical protein